MNTDNDCKVCYFFWVCRIRKFNIKTKFNSLPLKSCLRKKESCPLTPSIFRGELLKFCGCTRNKSTRTCPKETNVCFFNPIFAIIRIECISLCLDHPTEDQIPKFLVKMVATHSDMNHEKHPPKYMGKPFYNKRKVGIYSIVQTV